MKKPLLLAAIFISLAAGAVDDPAGLEALRAAATRGDVEAQLELGILYEYGFRQPDNLVPALAWYLRAADAGKAEAAKRRDALSAKLKPAEVEQAKRLAPTLVSAAPPAAPSPAPPASAPSAETPPPADAPAASSSAPAATTTPNKP